MILRPRRAPRPEGDRPRGPWWWARRVLLWTVGVLAVGYGQLYLVMGLAMGEFSRDGGGMRFLRDEPMTSVEVPEVDCRERTDAGGQGWKGGWQAATYVRTCDEDSVERRREAVARLAHDAVLHGWQEVPDPITGRWLADGDPDGEPATRYFAKAVAGRNRPARLEISSQGGTYTAPGFMVRITAGS